MSVYALDKLMEETRRLAVECRRSTGRPLPVTSELAKFDAMRLLALEAPAVEEAGCDAIGTGERAGLKVQIKGRVVTDPRKASPRVGQVRPEAAWDLLVVVLLDDAFEPYEIYEADRASVTAMLERGGASRRTGRGAFTVARMRAAGRLAWRRGAGAAGASAG